MGSGGIAPLGRLRRGALGAVVRGHSERFDVILLVMLSGMPTVGVGPV